MKAVKGNKEYSINETQSKQYQDAGFDITDDSGKVISYGRGKTVSYDEYVRMEEENKALREKVSELEAAQEEKESKKQTKNGKASKEDGE